MANKEFYRLARAYDAAFGGRDYKEEIDFIEWCFSAFAESDLPRRVVELGCGPARHAAEFSRRGWDTSALDLSEDMIDYAKIVAAEESVDVRFYCGDMIGYELDNPAALTTIFTESITHILTNEDFVKHLQSVSRNLLPGGLYIIETAHPHYFFPDDEDNIWTAEMDNHLVEVVFGSSDDEYDPFLQQWDVTTRMTIKEDDRVIEVNESKSKHRWYLAQELKALIQISGEFDEVHFFGSMTIPPAGISYAPESDCMIVVLKKNANSGRAPATK